MKRLLTALLCLLMVTTMVMGQAARRLDGANGGLGNNMEAGMGVGAGREGRDSTVQDRTTPKEIHSWHVDKTLGEVILCEPDTVVHQAQNIHLTDGLNGEYNWLGNMGSPRESRIFFHRPYGNDYIFANPMDYFLYSPNQFYFIDTKSPYTNVSYYRAGNKQNGEERIKGVYAVNVNKRLGFGFNLDYVYGRGLYSNQATSLFDAALYGYYRGEKYCMHFLLDYDKLKWAENGGITDDRYITSPQEMSSGRQTYRSSDMPVRLDRTWNENKMRTAFLEQHFNIGYYKARTDSMPDTVIVHHDYVPFMKVFHTAHVKYDARRFIDYRNPRDIYADEFLPYDSIDATGYLSVKNTAGISLIEGLNKWIPFGGSAYIQHEYRSFTLPDTLGGSEIVSRYNENDITLGGNIRRTIGDLLHFNVTAETVMAGTRFGDASLVGNGDLNFKLLKDTVHVAFDGFMKNSTPAFYYRHYHAQHFWWDNDFQREFRTHLGGSLSFDRLHTRLSAGVENILNYTYLAYAGYGKPSGGKQTFLDGVTARQCDSNIQVLSATLNQDFALGVLHWDNEVTAQYSTRDDIIPLPLLNVYSNLYLKFTYAKVLRIELGGDVRYFTSYYAPDYCPAIGQYFLQNPDEEARIKLGNYPFVNVYANFHLKQCRFYVMFYHVNDHLLGTANSFLVPHYPVNPRWFKLGLSWNFWD